MAHAKSAIKRHRQSLKRKARNRTRKSEARGALTRARELVAGGSKDEAEGAVRRASSVLDRAARKGVVHANTAARYKSRLMRQLNTSGGDAKRAARGRS